MKFVVQGEEFDDGAQQETGHIQIDFGLDSLFVQENVELTDETQAKIRDNVSKLVEFTKKAGDEYARHFAAPVVRIRREPSAETDRAPTESAVIKINSQRRGRSGRRDLVVS